jgi:hypothetical protein
MTKMTKEQILKKIENIETMMQDPGFYSQSDFQEHL